MFLTENPEIAISHGADTRHTYYDRTVTIYDGGGNLRFTSSSKWFHQHVVNIH